MSADLWATLDAAGKAENIDPRLLYAVGMRESSLGKNTGLSLPNDPDSPRGFFQMRPSTAQSLIGKQPQSLYDQAVATARYLSEGLDKTGSIEGATAYYHGGPDKSIWGPKTADYSRGVTQNYMQLASAKKPGASQVMSDAGSTDPDLAAGSALVAVSHPQAGVSGAMPDIVQQRLDEFRKQGFGGDSASTEVPATTPAPSPSTDPDLAAGQALVQQSAPAAPAASKPVDYSTFGHLASDDTQAALETARTQEAAKPGDQVVREALAPAPNTNYGSVLPFATNADGTNLRIALPSSLRDLAQQTYGLSQEVPTGTVSPQGTAALANIALSGGLGTSVAAGSGAVIANRLLPQENAALGRAEAPDLLGAQFRSAPTLDGAGMASSLTGDVQPNRLIPGKPVASQAPTAIANAADDAATGAQPSAGMGGAVPRSVGAAASSSAENQLTPAQVQAYRSTAEGQKFLEPQSLTRDDNMYVPGVQPNAAEIEQSVNHARELKALGQASPAVSAEAKLVAEENNSARMDFFNRIAGSDVDIANAKAARSAQAQSDLDAAWAQKTVADPSPVLNTAQQILRSPDGVRPIVKSAVKSVTDAMVDADGNPITDPEMLYGVRKHIDDMMSKEGSASDPKSVRAQASLQAIKDQLDGVIEGAAPGFRQYLDNFSAASRPIDAMQSLQGFENKLVDSRNNMQYSRVQNMMRQIVDSRAAPGINAYKSIPDDMMGQLWGLRDDLRRSATALDLAKAPGSDTSQNFMDAVRFGTNAAVQAGANAIAPGYGSMAIAGVKGAFAPMLAARSARQQAARAMDLLRPKTELQNRLLDGP